MAVAVTLSMLIACIEIPTKSKTRLRACVVAEAALYWMVLSCGNVITTLLASTEVARLPAEFAPYGFLFSAFAGVFGFAAVLKKRIS